MTFQFQVTKKPPVSKEGRSGSQERPGSRMGFVAMAPDKSPPPQRKETKKVKDIPCDSNLKVYKVKKMKSS